MVQLTEVVDEHFQEDQAGPEDEEDFTDTGTSHDCLLFLFTSNILRSFSSFGRSR